MVEGTLSKAEELLDQIPDGKFADSNQIESILLSYHIIDLFVAIYCYETNRDLFPVEMSTEMDRLLARIYYEKSQKLLEVGQIVPAEKLLLCACEKLLLAHKKQPGNKYW